MNGRRTLNTGAEDSTAGERSTSGAGPVPALPGIRFVCPLCKGELETLPDAYRCTPCDRDYPVVLGIPDFRIAPDPWLSFEEDLQRALLLRDTIEGLDFEESVRAYWRLVPDASPELAERFIDHVVHAEARSRQWLEVVMPPTDPTTGADRAPWLDLGCGTGDFAVAALSRGASVVAVDIAFRWMFLSHKRPGMSDERILRVCACAEALPFPEETFGRAFALGLLEHCADERPVLSEACRVLVPGGTLNLRTVNRFSLAREPHVRVWGVGFLPRPMADAYVGWRTGRSYARHRPLSCLELKRGLARAGFSEVAVRPADVLEADLHRLAPRWRVLVPPYRVLHRLPVLRALIAWIAPLVEAAGRRRR